MAAVSSPNGFQFNWRNETNVEETIRKQPILKILVPMLNMADLFHVPFCSADTK